MLIDPNGKWRRRTYNITRKLVHSNNYISYQFLQFLFSVLFDILSFHGDDFITSSCGYSTVSMNKNISTVSEEPVTSSLMVKVTAVDIYK
jgi:hypothetical protein